MKKQIQIFKPGKHTAMSGASLSFTEADLKASASAYDPAKHEAPIVVGHPSHDAPAYGWIRSLQYAGALEAEHQQIDPAFAEMVDRGAFKKISASFYMPDSPSNPVPGVYYLRHVGFLGAQPPAVKGLRNPEFADAETGVVEFADYDDMTVAALFRRLREWFIGEKGLDEADKIIPDYQVASLEQSARQETDDTDQAGASLPAQFTEKGSDQVTPEEKARIEAENAKLKADNEKLKTDAAAFAEVQTKAKRASIHAEHLAFAETLVKAGKLLPANKDLTVATLDFMAAQETVVEFGEGDAKKPLLDAHKAMLQALPKIVEFKELAGAEHDADAGTVSFATPSGYAVDTARLEIHQKALAHQKTHNTTYETALTAVS